MNDYNIAYVSKTGGNQIISFVKTHLENLDGNVFFYYGGKIPTHLEGKGKIEITRINYYLSKVKKKLGLKNQFELQENEIYKSFKENNIDIVYVDFGTIASSLVNVCKSLKIPMVVAFLGYDISMKHVLKEFEKPYVSLFKYASKVLVVSKHMVPKLKAMGCNKDKIFWSPYPPEDMFYATKPSFTSKQFFMMGRFVDKKAPYYSILAFKKVLENFPEASLVIAGSGPLLQASKNLCRYFNIVSKVKFVGKIDQHKANEYYRSSIAFIQHSISSENGDQEGTPVSILEASLAGLPVVSTIHAGIPDVIINNITGILIEEHDVKSMALGMEFILKDSIRAKEMGLKGKEFIYENFRKELHMGKLNGIIQEIVGK